MPTFMLDDLIENDSSLTVKDLQLIFNVEYEFAEKRLTQYFNNKNMLKWNSHFYCIFNNRIGGVYYGEYNKAWKDVAVLC